MKTTIPTFPDTISREAFGWYVSGLTDGEGCFSLRMDDREAKRGRRRRRVLTSCASFTIALRSDDIEILRLIQSFFGCGKVIRVGKGNTHAVRFRTLDELTTIVTHFDKFNLFAKKKADFVIWREAVCLMLLISDRKQGSKGGRYGRMYKWANAEREEFISLRDQLSAGRKLKVGSI